MAQIISPNMLKTFKNCPKKYAFKYIKGLSMPVNDEIFITGKNIHALASYYLRKENIDKMENSLTPREKDLWSYLKNTEYFRYECIKTEYNLAFKLENYFFGGRLDALVKNDDRYYILDYKTGAAPKDAKFDFQTIIYLLAVKNFYKTENVTFVYLDLKSKTDVKIDLTEDLSKEYEQILTEYALETDRKEFPARGKNCEFCEYGKICYDKKLSD